MGRHLKGCQCEIHAGKVKGEEPKPAEKILPDAFGRGKPMGVPDGRYLNIVRCDGGWKLVAVKIGGDKIRLCTESVVNLFGVHMGNVINEFEARQQ